MNGERKSRNLVIGLLFAIIVFGELFGFVGMIFGVPVFAIIYKFISHEVDKYLQKRIKD